MMKTETQFEVNDVVTWEVVGCDGTFSVSKRVYGTVQKVNKVTLTVLRADTQTKANVNKNDWTLVKLPYKYEELAGFLGALR
jgi:hypothetical protein